MKKLNLVTFLTPMLLAFQMAIAADLGKAEYSNEFIECTVVEVAIQYESGVHETKYECFEENMSGKVYSLESAQSNFLTQFEAKSKVSNIDQNDSRVVMGKNANSSQNKITLNARSYYRIQDTIILTDDTDWSMTNSPPDLESISARMSSANSGTKVSSVLIVHITANDFSTSASPSRLSDSVFGTHGDPVNLASQYAACSYNAQTFVPAAGASIVDGVIQVTIDQTVNGVENGIVVNKAIAAVNQKLGVEASKLYDYVMFAVPAGTQGGWIAYANINSWKSVYNDNWATYVSAQMHEVGHNLGRAHSNEGNVNYGDQSGMMGFSYSEDDTPVQCFNASKNSRFGWYGDKKITITDTWKGKLIGLSDYANSTEDQKVILHVEDGQSSDMGSIDIGYNRKEGINKGTKEAGNQVLVVKSAEPTGYSESNLIAKLNSGESYTIPDFQDENLDLVISVGNFIVDTNNVTYADVSVTIKDTAQKYFELTIENGTGDGNYTAGATVGIIADTAPSGQEFDKWVLNSGSATIASPTSSSTTVLIESSDARISATYLDLPTLTVDFGIGDGRYSPGSSAEIIANSPLAGQVFDQWVVSSGDATIDSPTDQSTRVWIGSEDSTITATYADLSALTVIGGSGGGSYLMKTSVTIVADAPPSGQEFDQWIVSAGEATINSKASMNTTVTVNSVNTTVTATYRSVIKIIPTFGGSLSLLPMLIALVLVAFRFKPIHPKN
ncbi:InlB B-repeat-containing protein [Reinekea sp.]|jgi:hypothetical protein|uniref:InlB B-repeat-containing protein n=1 Tax=Reinekea sp. TaxID=1970455 RepID=UPI00398A220A